VVMTGGQRRGPWCVSSHRETAVMSVFNRLGQQISPGMCVTVVGADAGMHGGGRNAERRLIML
jgi:hypothetical protein